MPYDFRMLQSQLLPCDGCGQLADSQHISRRLQRLEWATRFRPIHIQSLLVAGIPPFRDDEFLYSAPREFKGEARRILDAVQITTEGKESETVLAEFQKRGLMLIHVLHCALPELPGWEARRILQNQLAATVTRIRRSLKPKRVLLISPEIVPLVGSLRHADLGCPVFPTAPGAFLSNLAPNEAEVEAFRAALQKANGQAA